ATGPLLEKGEELVGRYFRIVNTARDANSAQLRIQFADQGGVGPAGQIDRLALDRLDGVVLGVDQPENLRDEAFGQAVRLAAVEGQPHLVGADLVLETQRDHRRARRREGPVVRRRIDGEADALQGLFGAQLLHRAGDEGRLRPGVLAV